MKKTLLLLFAAFATLVTNAHNFEVGGIYYNITSEADKTAEVTFKGDSYDSHYDEYSGSITIPATVTHNGVAYSVTSIGDDAFYFCSSLTDITIPEGVTSIGGSAFYGCSSLTDITLPEGVTSIGDDAFRGCSSLTDINIPEGVTSIGGRAFEGCSKLSSITIPEGVTSIGEWAFEGCSSLTDINIPEGVTSIGYYAFCRCSDLTTITIPESVTSIGYEAFLDCRSLTDINIPEGVTSIGSGAFRNCSGLTDINIPEGVTSIGGRTFAYCSSLTTIVLPKSVKDIYYEAFVGCSELTDVYCYAETVPGTGADVFDGRYIEYATLHVPASAMNSYKTTAPWSGFGTIKTIEYVTPEKCATPTISYVDGKVVFACDTDGAIVKSNFKDNNASAYSDSEVLFIPTYTLTAYATKANYEKSDEVTLTLCWVPCEEHEEEDDESTGILTIPSRPVLIQTNGGVITVSGLAEGTDVAVVATNGISTATATAIDGTATLATNLTPGTIAIVKIGKHCVTVVIK